MKDKRAIIFGITGQDGSLLASLLLYLGYKVCGVRRRTSNDNALWRLQELDILNNPNMEIVFGDITDQGSIERIIIDFKPTEIYNLAAQSFVGASWQLPISTLDITGLGAIRIFDAVRNIIKDQRLDPQEIKIYQASSSEMFGGANRTEALTEQSVFEPRSPYGIAKCAAHQSARNYRDSYGMFISCGILFNHESPYRGLEFVSRKITDGVSKIYFGELDKIKLGNLDAVRDWGDAEDYVYAMYRMLQIDKSDDFVICTGEAFSVRDLCREAFKNVRIDDWEKYVVVDEALKRPADVGHLLGSCKKAEEILDWTRKSSFPELIKKMVEKDLERNKGEHIYKF